MGTALLERTAEIAAVDALLASVANDRAGCLVIEGPAGIGKTSVLDHAAEEGQNRGLRVRRAAGDDLEAALPFGMVRRLFDDVPDSWSSGTAALAAPALAPHAGSADSGDLFPLLHGLHRLTLELVEDAPQLLLLDDVQWSDLQSLRFVSYLLNRVHDLPVGLVLAGRTGTPTTDGTTDLVGRIQESPGTVVCRLDALTSTSVATLVRSEHPAATEAFCAVVAEATGGNPFLCREMLSTIRAEAIEPTDAGAARVGELHHAGIRTSILVRLGQLGHDASAVAAGVAVLGMSASLPRVATVVGMESARASAAVDRLVVAGILAEHRSRLDFVHPIIRETVYADIGPGRRSADHRQIARQLLDEHADASEIATHVLAAGGRPDPDMVPVLRAAAGAAMNRGAPERCAELLSAALDASGGSETRPRILVELGRAEAAAGEVSAVGHFRDALGSLAATESDAAVARDIGEALYGAGQYQDARLAFERGLHVLGTAEGEGGGGVLEAGLVAGLDMAATLLGVPGLLADERLAADLMASAPRTLATRALLGLAAARHALGVRVAPEDWRHARTVELASAALDGPPLPLELGTTVLEPLALSLFITRQVADARSLLDRLLGLATDRGQLATYASLLPVRGLVNLASGQLVRAVADGAHAVRLGEEFPSVNTQTDAAARYVLAHASLLRGDQATAVRAVTVPDAEERWGGSVLHGWFLYAAGHVALDRGDPAAARTSFEAAGARFLSAGGPAAYCAWRTGASLAAEALGDRAHAIELAAEELRLAEEFGTPDPIAEALRARARLGPAAEAVAPLMCAMETLSEGSPLTRAGVEVDLGSTLRRLGRRAEARDHLRAGLAGASACGARPLAARARAELEVAGARRPTRAMTGLAALTPSERRVAGLAGTGLTNREIAEALFVTRKTVEVHLSACYRKLAIRSRAELAEALVET